MSDQKQVLGTCAIDMVPHCFTFPCLSWKPLPAVTEQAPVEAGKAVQPEINEDDLRGDQMWRI